MSIDSLRSGAIRICFSDALNAYPSKCRILIEGQMLDSGHADDGELIKIPSLRDVDSLFGEGSVISEGLKTAFLCCPEGSMEFFALPWKDASVGAVAKAVYEIKFEQNIFTPGRIDLFIGDGRWNTSTRILAGMKDDDVAAAVALSLQSETGLPFDVVQGDPAAGTGEGNIVRLTAKNAGSVGNCISIIPNWHGRRNYLPEAEEPWFKPFTITVTQPMAGTNIAFQVPDYNSILGECCYCCIGMLYDSLEWQDAMIAYIASAWACDKPQCFGHGYTYNQGSFGEILAADTNSAEVCRIAHCCTDPSIGWLKVAAFAAHSCCATIEHPELSVQGPQDGILACLRIPESCTQCFTFEEQQLLQATGFVVTVPLAGGTGHLTQPMIVNDSTNNRYDENGRLNSTWWDTNSRRLAAATADQMAVNLGPILGLGLFTKNTTIPEGVRGTNPRMILGQIRAWAKSQIGILFSEFDDIDKDIILRTDFEVAPKCQGVCGKLWLDFTYKPPCRIDRITINAQPRMLLNC